MFTGCAFKSFGTLVTFVLNKRLPYFLSKRHVSNKRCAIINEPEWEPRSIKRLSQIGAGDWGGGAGNGVTVTKL